MRQEQNIQKLYTNAGMQVQEIPWNVYPRPQLKRTKWICLNGIWEIKTESGFQGNIKVPFCPESLLSGFKGKIRYGEKLHYQRTFTIPQDWMEKRILLHFGAVSSTCEVLINGQMVGHHENGYLSFTLDITKVLKSKGEENLLEVIVQNDLSGRLPSGKQKEKRGGMWYTPCSGIWQSVWMEPVPEHYVESLKIQVDLEGADIFTNGITEGALVCEGKSYEIVNGKVRVCPEQPRWWSPEDPYLYDFSIKSGEDEIRSYFALRSIEVREGKDYPDLYLNEKPYFFHGLLDQGYVSDGLYTPADPSLYEQDILAMKALGFNMLRKHIKIEPEQFYYDCDRLGMVVFQDMVNNSDYKFLRDTAIATIGFKKLKDKRKHKNSIFRQAFEEAMKATITQLWNHSCICYWTIFNEGWGQFDADRMYKIAKQMDPTRIIDATSGWFAQKESDVESLHMYFEKLHLGKNKALPQVLSEFGGYVYKDEEHSFNLTKTYGYKIYQDRETFVKAFQQVYMEQIVPLVRKGLSATVYTQLSDVEDETNGILTYDRKVCKLYPNETSSIKEALFMALKERCKEE